MAYTLYLELHLVVVWFTNLFLRTLFLWRLYLRTFFTLAPVFFIFDFFSREILLLLNSFVHLCISLNKYTMTTVQFLLLAGLLAIIFVGVMISRHGLDSVAKFFKGLPSRFQKRPASIKTRQSVPDGFRQISKMDSGKSQFVVSGMNVEGGCLINSYSYIRGREANVLHFHPRKKLITDFDGSNVVL